LLAPLAADRALNPPPSSSLAKEERLRSFLLHAPARDPYLIARFRSLQTALWTRRRRRLSQRKTPPLVPPPCAGARSVSDCSLSLAADRAL